MVKSKCAFSWFSPFNQVDNNRKIVVNFILLCLYLFVLKFFVMSSSNFCWVIKLVVPKMFFRIEIKLNWQIIYAVVCLWGVDFSLIRYLKHNYRLFYFTKIETNRNFLISIYQMLSHEWDEVYKISLKRTTYKLTFKIFMCLNVFVH